MIDPWQPSMTLYKLLSRQPSSPRKWAQFSDLNTIASDVVRLPRFHSVHDGGGVVAKLSLADDAHGHSVAPCSPARYTVKSRLFDVLPDDTWFYPGHGDDSTLGEQKPHIDEWRSCGW
jgi:hypothetical protein